MSTTATVSITRKQEPITLTDAAAAKVAELLAAEADAEQLSLARRGQARRVLGLLLRHVLRHRGRRRRRRPDLRRRPRRRRRQERGAAHGRDARLHRRAAGRGVPHHEPERDPDLRLRQLVQLTAPAAADAAVSFRLNGARRRGPAPRHAARGAPRRPRSPRREGRLRTPGPVRVLHGARRRPAPGRVRDPGREGRGSRRHDARGHRRRRARRARRRVRRDGGVPVRVLHAGHRRAARRAPRAGRDRRALGPHRARRAPVPVHRVPADRRGRPRRAVRRAAARAEGPRRRDGDGRRSRAATRQRRRTRRRPRRSRRSPTTPRPRAPLRRARLGASRLRRGGELAPRPARARAARQGRNSTVALRHPVALPEGDFDLTLQTTWVEPAYLEPDASWCAPGALPASPAGNAGDVRREEPLAGRRGRRSARRRRAASRCARAGPARRSCCAARSGRRSPSGCARDGTGIVRLGWTPGSCEPRRAVRRACGRSATGLARRGRRARGAARGHDAPGRRRSPRCSRPSRCCDADSDGGCSVRTANGASASVALRDGALARRRSTPAIRCASRRPAASRSAPCTRATRW